RRAAAPGGIAGARRETTEVRQHSRQLAVVDVDVAAAIEEVPGQAPPKLRRGLREDGPRGDHPGIAPGRLARGFAPVDERDRETSAGEFDGGADADDAGAENMDRSGHE